MKTTDNIGTNRNVKDRVLILLLEDKNVALELYNGLNETSYTNAGDLEITTLSDAVYMKMKNDVSLLIDGNLQLYEHQSTYNPNMPVRGFLYFADLYRQLLHGKHIYSLKLIPLPSPKYIVLYNGTKDIGEDEWLKLSDAFIYGNEHSQMELRVHMININYGHNTELMERCQTLKEYAMFIDKIKKCRETMDFPAAVDTAVKECINENVLADFLGKRRAEIMNAILTEYDEEQVLKDLSQEFYEDGMAYGLKRGEAKVIISQVCKKLKKGKNCQTIASELEEEEVYIQHILDVAEKYAPNYDVELVYQEFEKQTLQQTRLLF